MTLEEQIYEEVLQRMDLSRETGDEEVEELIYKVLREEAEKDYIPLQEQIQISRKLFHAFRKLDILQEFLEDETITEIMINGTKDIFLEKNGRIFRSGKHFISEEKLEDVIQQIVSRTNRYVNELSPIADARLEEIGRAHV